MKYDAFLNEILSDPQSMIGDYGKSRIDYLVTLAIRENRVNDLSEVIEVEDILKSFVRQRLEDSVVFHNLLRYERGKAAEEIFSSYDFEGLIESEYGFRHDKIVDAGDWTIDDETWDRTVFIETGALYGQEDIETGALYGQEETNIMLIFIIIFKENSTIPQRKLVIPGD